MAIIIKDRLKGIWKSAKAMDLDQLHGWRMTIIFFIVINLFGFWWYMEWKKFSMALFIVSIVFLTIVLFLERGAKDKMPEEKQEDKKEKEEEEPKEEKKEEKKKEPSMDFNVDLGMGTPEEFNERAEKAFGTI